MPSMPSKASLQTCRGLDMPDNWRKTIVGEIASAARNSLVGGPFGSNLVGIDYVDYGVPVIRGQNLGNRWVSGDFVFVTPEKAESLNANIAKPGDIVFTQRGTLGQVCLVPQGLFDRYLISQSQMKLSVNPEIANPVFFYYVFSSSEQKNYIRQHAIQTGVPHTNLGILRNTPIPLPALSEQVAIAHILGTLDDKIELNQRTNETLEAMARALFKSWFVDFEPVRAKVEGRETGLPKEIADLFPDSFEDSELGKIPEGWHIDTLGNIIDLVYGKALRHEDRKSGNVAVFGSNGQIGWHNQKLVGGPGIIVGRKGNPGVVTWADRDFFPIDTTFYVVAKGETQSPHFLFYALRMHNLASIGADSEVPGLNRDMASMSKQLVPPPSLSDAFDSYARPFFLRIRESDDQSQTLAALRDTLLPKLISGEVRVNAVERFVETST